MKNQFKGILITITGASMWGLCAVAGKYIMGTKGVDPVWMVTLRLLTAGIILLGIALVKSKANGIFDIWKDKKSILRLLVVAVFAFAVCQTSYFAAIHLSNAGITTAIQQTAPVFVLLWVLISEKRMPKIIEVLVLCMVVFGAFTLATGGKIDSLVLPMNALILGLIFAVTCAMYTVLPGTVFAFGFVVIFGTVTAFAAYLYGITIVGPLKGSILGLIEPVVAAFASALILRQAFALSDIIGIIAILGGVMILSIYKGTKAAV